MDDVIFEEFKGTGNMELQLDRKLSERRMFPAIDIKRSGTRREELLFRQEELNLMWMLRNAWADSSTVESMQEILATIRKTGSNDDLLRVAPLLLQEPRAGAAEVEEERETGIKPRKKTDSSRGSARRTPRREDERQNL